MIRVATYASLRSSEDGTSPLNQGNSARMASMLANISAALSFLDTEILALPIGTIEQYIQQEPELNVFKKLSRRFIREKKPHTLSAELEETLASLGEVHDAPYMIYQRGKIIRHAIFGH